MFVGELKKLVVPPCRSWAPAEEDWQKVYEELSTNLPADYKELIDTYGAGTYGDFICVHDPFTNNEFINLLKQHHVRLSALRELRDGGTELIPYPLFPDPGGLLPCAATDNGDVVYWMTTGPPDKWSIAVNAARDDRWDRFDICLTEFLYHVLRGDLRVSMFPTDFPPPKVEFRPWIESAS